MSSSEIRIKETELPERGLVIVTASGLTPLCSGRSKRLRRVI